MATNESFVFAGTEWNDFTNFRIQAFDPGVAPKRWNWIQGADSDGALTVEEAHFDNAEMTLRVRITQQAGMDAALTKIGTLLDAIQEAEKNPLGSACTWTPAGSTKSVTGYVLGGEVTGMPIELSGDDAGWFVRAPVLTIKLTRRPFWYGAEVTVGASTSTLPLIEYTVASVTGDVPAEARLIVTDNATQSRRHVEWGLEQRYYNAATSLLLDSDSLVTTGFGGTGTTRSGAYDPGAAGNSVVRGTLTTGASAICGTGNLAHVGTFRVKARVYAVAASLETDIKVRLSWQEGDGPFRSNDYTSPVVNNNWSEVDLGLVSIPEKALGTQKWSARIDAYSSTVGDTIDIDYLTFVPAGEGYGKARAGTNNDTGVLVAHDEFTGAAGALNGRVAPAGGTWATSGSVTAPDFTGSSNTVTRNPAGADAGVGRFGILGATNYTDSEVSIDWSQTASINSADYGVIARWVDANNYLLLRFRTTTTPHLALIKVVAGVTTTIADVPPAPYTNSTFYTLKIAVTAGGAVTGRLYLGNSLLKTVSGSDSVLATGGALQTGKPGILHYVNVGTATTFSFDNFTVSTPAAEPIVVYSGRAAEIRHDSAIRQDSTGTYYGPMPTYRGSRFLLPCAGSAARTARLGVKVRRNDLDVAADDQIADSTTVQCKYTPRYVAIPR